MSQANTNTVPYHMQDESQSEDDEGWSDLGESTTSTQVGSEDESIKGKKGKSKSKERDSKEGGLGSLFGGGRKVKLGNIELHPDIDYTDWKKSTPSLDSRAKIDQDGMINIWVNLKQALPDLPKDYARPVKELAVDPVGAKDCPPLNIVIFIVGSRGDVQPYVSLALHLINSHAHRVRIATHPDFKDFVLGANKRLKGKETRGLKLDGRLEFFDVGGDPKELMAYMVKNPGLIPAWETLKSGDITKKRQMTQDMLQGFYHSCIDPNPQTQEPFAADAIISNPPAFGHVHIAEALGLPLMMSFTMPWSPTTEFKHPLVNIKSSNAEMRLTNYFSYGLAEILQWQGLGDIINHFRAGTLGLAPLDSRGGTGVLERTKVPWTYCWSQGLIEKPEDWKEHIDISGFYFMAGDDDFKPDDDLVEFLKKGDAPVYIGFGSVVVEDAAAMTKTIFEGVKKAGCRALVSAGWGGLGGTEVPDEVFILKGNIPHDWLFADGRVSAVCHHGGAGTTAIGLRNGLPTIVVPFFGDQKFWGDMIHRAGAGPPPIPQKTLSADNLAEGIKFALSDGAKTAAGKMGETIRRENGEIKGVESFHKHLPLKSMRCDVDPTRIAIWYSEDLCLRLCAEVAAVWSEAGKIDLRDLRPLRAREYPTKITASDPLTGGSYALLHTVYNHYRSAAQIFYDPPKGIVNTMFVIPQGLLDTVAAVFEGFDSIPKAIGSEQRERGKIDNLGSGFKEGGKGLLYGWWDGITGLVTEPIAGGKKEGALGVIKGMGRSYVNVTARPAAGILGVMALPMQGAWKSLRRTAGGAPEKAIGKSRLSSTQSLIPNIPNQRKKELLTKYAEFEKGTKARKEREKKKVKLFLMGEENVDLGDEEIEKKTKKYEQEAEKQGSEPSASPQRKEGSEDKREGGGEEEGMSTKMQVPASAAGGGEMGNRLESEMKTDPQKLKEIQEAEERGYQKALEELKRREKGGSS